MMKFRKNKDKKKVEPSIEELKQIVPLGDELVGPVKVGGAGAQGAASPVSPGDAVASAEQEAEDEANSNKKRKRMGRRAKAVVFGLIGLALVVGNFFIETTLGRDRNVIDEAFEGFDYSVENIVPDSGVIRFDVDNDLGITNDVQLESMSEMGHEYIFNISSGKFWANFKSSNAKANFVVGKVVLIPHNAIFDLSYDGNDLDLQVYDGDVYIGFLDSGLSIEFYESQYSSIFDNIILVPRESQVFISMDKLDERIKHILFSKLVKELKYSAISKDVKESKWVRGNQSLDRRYLENLRQDFRGDVLARGLVAADVSGTDFVFWARENLTLVPNKKREVLFDNLFGFLDDAIYYSVKGGGPLKERSMNIFYAREDALQKEIADSFEYQRLIDDYIDSLRIFGPGDGPYEVWFDLRVRAFDRNIDVYGVVGDLWQDIYEAMDVSNSLAQQAFEDFYSYFEKTLGDHDDPRFHLRYLTYYNQLFDNVLLRYPTFYEDEYFAVKHLLEQELLLAHFDPELEREIRQAMIATKINFLNRLKAFFFAEDVSLEEAIVIFDRVIGEIDELMPVDQSEVAVVEFFESQIEEFADFWGYLSSAEYNGSSIYGDTHAERYDTYLVERDTIWSLINIQQDILGDTVDVQEETIADVQQEVMDYFAAYADAKELQIGEILEVGQRFVDVTAVVAGYPVEAVYDRDVRALTDVYAYGELISDRSIQLVGLGELLKRTFAEVTVDPSELVDGEEVEFNVESFAQREARIYITRLVSNNGFNVELKNVSVLGEDIGLYRVGQAALADVPTTIVTFDFAISGEVAKNVFVSIDGEPIVLDGEYTLEELQAVIVAENDFSNPDLEEDPDEDSEEVVEEDPEVVVEDEEDGDSGQETGGGVLRR